MQPITNGDCAGSASLSSMIPMMPAVAAKVVVDPARAAANRRPPERPTEYGADDPSGNSAYRTGHQKARTRTGSCTNHIGAGARGGRRETGKDRRSQSKLTQGFPPYHAIPHRNRHTQKPK